MPSKSTLTHFRFNFSLFLAPVFAFALLDSNLIEIWKSSILFLILMLSIFPASNAFNSFYDRDEGSIGGIEKPLAVEPQLLGYSLAIEGIGLLASLSLSFEIFCSLLIYGVFSKLYSHPKIRFKASPWKSFIVVCFFQGPWIYSSVIINNNAWPSLLGLGVSFLMMAAVYPITQVYQHREDAKRGDLTLSLCLGVKGTFYWCAGSFVFMNIILSLHWGLTQNLAIFILINSLTFVFLLRWFLSVRKSLLAANFKETHLFLKTSTFTSLLSILLCFFFSGLAWATGVTTEPWFTLHKEKVGQTYKITFKDLDGETLSYEEVELAQDGSLLRYEWDQRQTQTKVKVQREEKGFKIINGSDVSTLDVKNVVVPPLLSEALQIQLSQNSELKSYTFNLLVPDKGRSFEFRFKKLDKQTWRLAPTSFFVRLVAGEINFKYDEKQRLIEVSQFTPPVKFKTQSGRLEEKKTSVRFTYE